MKDDEVSPLLKVSEFSRTYDLLDDYPILEVCFADDLNGRVFRTRLYVGWGLFSVCFAYTILCSAYGYSSGKSFFIASTTITTIGYGPIYDPDDHADDDFLAAYFFVFVIPFMFLQFVASMGDASALAESVQRSMDAKSSPPSALTRSEAFLSCLLWSLAEVCFLMLLMLVTGAMYYKFFTDRETWGEGVFYAITTIATIGYGGEFQLDDDWGYYAVGMYAIICNVGLSYIFSRLAAYTIVLSSMINEKRARRSGRRDTRGQSPRYPIKAQGLESDNESVVTI